jgi:dimethylamine monooxygenase subunit B
MTLSSGDYLTLQVTAIDPVTDTVTSFAFAHPDGLDLPAFSPGAHVMLRLGVDGQVRRNSYTLTGDPDDRRSYRITVQHQPEGRGGSHFLHRSLGLGDLVAVRLPMNFFAIDTMARRHLLIAGGIGITPFLTIAQELNRKAAPFELHHAFAREAAFMAQLKALYGDRVQHYSAAAGQRLDIPALLARQPLGTHVYVCGPPRMIEAVVQAAARLGWPSSCLHYERFRANAEGRAFSLRMQGSPAAEIWVGAEKTMLEALEDAGLAPDSMCRVGACGRCLLKVRGYSGRLIHHDHVLTESEKAAGNAILACVSRCEGQIDVERPAAQEGD